MFYLIFRNILMLLFSTSAFDLSYKKINMFPENRFYITYYGTNCENCIYSVIQQIRQTDSGAPIIIVSPGFSGEEVIYVRRKIRALSNYVSGLSWMNNLDTFNLLAKGSKAAEVIYCRNDSCVKSSCYGSIEKLLQWVGNKQ
jgi:hypothetical protein